MSWEEYVNNPLWAILVETVHAMIMYPFHKAFTRDVVLNEQPDTTPRDLTVKLGIPLGEALVILYELWGSETRKGTRRSAHGEQITNT